MQPAFNKICLIGAESTGKSTLALALADELRSRGHWAIPLAETLRLFCQRTARVPAEDDQPWIFHAQVLAEHEAEAAWRSRSPRQDGWLICDSSPLITAFYSRWFFSSDDLLRAAMAHQNTYRLCLLTEPVLPWVADGIQRDSPEARTRMDRDLRHFLQQNGVAFQNITPAFDPVCGARTLAKALADQLDGRVST